ncbi:MAG: putative FmdB family regulatory protein [Myxococcota bacterium]|jgi:putative FmdB family regulatory protein
MPIYEYRCLSCDDVIELSLLMAEREAPGPCPSCSEGVLRQKIGRIGVKLNGWGFSSTDGMVADRPGRGSYKDVAERAERISDGG